MSFEGTSKEAGPERAGRVDFSRRAHLSELMDELCTYEELRECLRDLEQVNGVTFGYRPTLQWLKQIMGRTDAESGLHIVDVGCGGGDMLRRIERWAAQKGFAVRLTGIDVNPNAVRAAREFTPAGSKIQWVAGEAFSFDATGDPIDMVISSLFTHHLTDDGILRFVEWMERVARRGWFVNDLYRSRTPYFAFKALSMAVRWHRFVRHDGPVSFRRAFLPQEWRGYAESAGLSSSDVGIETHWPARLCVARVKAQ
jgi:2-polyprenyl-3-methyl-5-hydroxy-6-metoxy-1,4-benzoquinol methylase